MNDLSAPDGAIERHDPRSATGRMLDEPAETGYGEVPAAADVAAEPARDTDEASTANGYGEVPGDRDVQPTTGITAEGVSEGYGEVPAPSGREAPSAGSGTADWEPEQYDADRG